jgi:hypothetical protein
LNYGLERAWCVSPTKDANKVGECVFQLIMRIAEIHLYLMVLCDHLLFSQADSPTGFGGSCHVNLIFNNLLYEDFHHYSNYHNISNIFSAIGYDEGTVVLKLGNEKPVASLDTNTGKLVWAKSHDIQTMSLKGLGKDGDLQDGERLPLAARDMGACEVYPQGLQHNCNGAYIVGKGLDRDYGEDKG